MEFDAMRSGCIAVASHRIIQFFRIADSGNVDPMHQYSFTWFVNLFIKASETNDLMNQQLDSVCI